VVFATVLVRFASAPTILPVLPPSPPVRHSPPPFFFNGTFRAVYRHSIVPGGVYSAEEVQAAMLRDPVVAAHYVKLDRAKVVGAVLDQPRSVYVSYRIGHRTLWTASKIVLPAGERLLTDGTRVVRARCGNLVSETSGEPDGEQGVADASGERFSPDELDQQVVPPVVARGPDPLAAAPLSTPAGVLPAVGGTPVMLAAGGPESGPFFQPVTGALPLVLGGGEPTREQSPPRAVFEPLSTTTTSGVIEPPATTTTTGTVPPPTTTTGTVPTPPTTTTGVIVPPPTTTTGTVPPPTTTGTAPPPPPVTTGTGSPTTTSTGVLVLPTTTTSATPFTPTITTVAATSGTVPEPSRIALLVLAWAAFRYRRRPR